MASRPSYQTQAIVIGRTNFGEADRVIRLLTPEHGKVAAVAKGVRRIKSRSGGHLELFGEVNLMLIPGANLETVTSARLVWYPHSLSLDYDRLNLAFIMAKALDRLTEPGQPAPNQYRILREALGALEDAGDVALIGLWFKLQLLDALGYRPSLDSCVICGEHRPDAQYAFSTERGGIVCSSDAGTLDVPMTADQIKFWRLLFSYPYVTIMHITDAPALAVATQALADNFYEHHLGISLR